VEQQAQDPLHGVVHPCMDGTEHDHALLKAGKGGSNRHVLVRIRQLFKGGSHHALAGINQETKQAKEHWAWRVVGHWHDGLANVVSSEAALDFYDLGRIDPFSLAT